MTDIILHDVPDGTHAEILRRAARSGCTVEEEVKAMIDNTIRIERIMRIADEKGLGSAFREIGREFNITDEFDNLRSPEPPRYPNFE